MLRYAEEFNKRGHDVVCYTPILDEYANNYLNLRHIVNAIIHKKNFVEETKQFPKVKIVRQLKISNKSIRNADITIATAWPTAFQVNELSEDKGKKVYFIQDFEIWDNEKLGKASYKLPLHHIIIAKWIDSILVNELGCKPGDLIHNGMDIERFIPDRSKKNMRHKDGEIQCLMLYHKLSKKGIDDGLAAFRKAKEVIPNLSLVMFGMPDDPNISDVKHYYQSPAKEKLVELYQTSDVFIYPSREEGWGLTPVEAMSCGCAVAGTKTGCMTEIGNNGINALLCEPYDVDNLATNIVSIASNADLRETLEKNGRKTAEGLSWDKSFDKFESVLINLADKDDTTVRKK
ncbi:glycosyl transferase [Intestinibaculum porci]|uniref:Glycosyl transferase n=2 Tax=Intestinibaculum porci TaxID=2487118 RepID=A0A3G9J8L5_9FIRM|nr:glycosyl transferase [Intestinibaculum porci]